MSLQYAHQLRRALSITQLPLPADYKLELIFVVGRCNKSKQNGNFISLEIEFEQMLTNTRISCSFTNAPLKKA